MMWAVRRPSHVLPLLAALLAAGPSAHAATQPGPPLLRAPAVDAPQLQNAGVWEAPPILVAGATAHRAGEFVYQDYLYDDLGAANGYAYPPDPRYAGNAADLVEVRLKPLPGETAIRLTYNSMVDPAVVATTLGLGSAPAPRDMPHGARARMPSAVFVTVQAGGADAVDAATGATIARGLPTLVDLARRQVEVRVPRAVFDGHDQRSVRVAAATGLWDPAAGAYVPQSAASFFNVAFRAGEPGGVPGGAFRSSRQAAALADGDLSPFFALADFVKLAAREDDERGVPRTGSIERIFASATEERQGRGDPRSRTRGCDSPCVAQYSGRLQPYTLYVPARPAPEGGFGLTLDLHACGASHNFAADSRRQRQLGERGAGHVVLSPLGRGGCYWFYGLSAADLFEAWADVVRRYPIDPRRTTATGISMGGHAAIRLAAAYPDLFARVAAVAPCPSAGIRWVSGGLPPGGRASRLVTMLPALRSIPVMTWQTATDESCPYFGPGRVGDVIAGLDRRGMTFTSWTFSGPSHNDLAGEALSESGPIAEFLGDARAAADPPRVGYTANVLLHEPLRGLPADAAYWLSEVRISRAHLKVGTIDVASAGFGVSRRRPSPALASSGRLEGGQLGPLEYASLSREPAGGQPTGRRRDRLDVRARNVASATVDPDRARVSCGVRIRARVARGPLLLRLAGCARSWALNDVCHATPVYDVVLRVPRGERRRSAAVFVAGRRLPVRRNRSRVDVRRAPGTVARARIVSLDASGRTIVRATTHRFCPSAG